MEPPGQELPAGQAPQSATEDAPVPALNEPLGHGAGATMAELGQNAPAGHVVQAAVKLAPPTENVPGAQGLVVPTAWPAPHQKPGGHTACVVFEDSEGQK